MKLRCAENSVRLRVSRSDLDRLDLEGRVQDRVGLPDGGSLVFALYLTEEAVDYQVHWRENTLSVGLPAAAGRSWIATDEVGLEERLPLPDGGALHLLVEKDFPCKHQPEVDRADTFTELAEKVQRED